MPTRTVRDYTEGDLPSIVDYFLDADRAYLELLGADVALLPPRRMWLADLAAQVALPAPEKAKHYVVWEVDGRAIGHCNVTEIEFGVTANMHLHIWDEADRRGGHGRALLPATISRHFELFELERIMCSPHAHNPPPNRTLPHLGFTLQRTYHGRPGPINFPQQVNEWRLEREVWLGSSTARPTGSAS